ncbi:MAG: DNA mismatch repair endonuclease MutL [Candidatus Eisenbacteria bacterium]|uniref:DNA mismatch repair protein MutL n=1 Tax=Eiseniibacteriota bacterium TaxID=2212470 RepID=A0A538UCH2_UNCEI|nr:MAG: DNA mismatch repair endonuclease MutL [Candidatus Eisenbacteria bacterium]
MSAPLLRTIRRLAPETASRIAAGEVIERPLSALKEVVENALDAGARRLELAIDGSLDRCFRVADDGSGIAEDELELALERHATSKIGALEDLDTLQSLGFRGEALPSIAAVSRLRIASRIEGEESAAFRSVEGGAVVERGRAPRARGTTVEVRDLFFNTPARRKFLKSETGETRAALRMLETYGLAFPEVAFRLVVDGRERFAWPAAASVRERAGAIWGARHAEQRLEIDAQRDGIRVQALLGLPEHARATRDGQQFLVNRRWIQSPVLSQALRQAYGNLLPTGRFPTAAVWLTVPPDRLDVNVHPTKREVRFADEDRVFALLAAAAAQRLAPLHPPFTVIQGGASEPRWAERVSEPPPDQTYLGFESAAPAGPAAGTSSAPRPAATPAGAVAAQPEVWQLHATYILAPVRGGLVIADQHAAHERILYEEARARLEGQQGASQQLLFPALVDLSRDQFELLLELGPSLQQLGWDLAPLGPPTVIIRGVPAGLRDDRAGSLLQDVLDGVAEESGRNARDDVVEHLARSYACHAAVRAGDPLTVEEMRVLLDRLFATSRPHGDPHGRPTFVRVELDELHRRFGRG